MLRVVFFSAMAFVSSGACAAIIASEASTVSSIDTYATVGGGDVTFTLSNNSLGTQCPWGFWIRASDPGSKSVLAQITAAHHGGNEVIIWADVDVDWGGAGTRTCLVYAVRVK
jgi:hypothetical protein